MMVLCLPGGGGDVTGEGDVTGGGDGEGRGLSGRRLASNITVAIPVPSNSILSLDTGILSI